MRPLWLLGAIVCLIWTGSAAAQVPPPPAPPCNTTRIIARYPLLCPTSPSTPSAPPGVPGFDLPERLHACSTLSNAASVVPASFYEELSYSFVLTKTSGALGTVDMANVAGAGYTALEYDCPMAAAGAGYVAPARREAATTGGTGSGAPGGLQAATAGSAKPGASHGPQAAAIGSAKYVPPEGWHAVMTGVADAVPEVRSQVKVSKAPRIRIAVVDSGVGTLFGTSLLKEGWSYQNPGQSSPAYWRTDTLGHGTAVAALALEASGYLAEVVSIQVLGPDGTGWWRDLARGTLVAVFDHDAKILNFSLAYPVVDAEPRGQWTSFLNNVYSATRFASTRMYAASGNRCGWWPDAECEGFYPAAAPANVTSVSGLNPDGDDSSQAVSSPDVDIRAPSEFICTTSQSTSKGGNAYNRRLSGTSFAAPQLAGGLALLWSWQAYLAGGELDDSTVDELQFNLHAPGTLDMCATLDLLGVYIEGCRSGPGYADPTAETCGEVTPAASSPPVSYLSWVALDESEQSFAVTELVPVEQQSDAVWCDGLNSVPFDPTCTSCDSCTSATQGLLEGVSIEANLRELRPGVYTDFQLRATVGGAYYYIPVEIPASMQGATTASFQYSALLPPLPDAVSELWLFAREQGTQAWNGAPLLTYDNMMGLAPGQCK